MFTATDHSQKSWSWTIVIGSPVDPPDDVVNERAVSRSSATSASLCCRISALLSRGNARSESSGRCGSSVTPRSR